MGLFSELFIMNKSDRRIILSLLALMVVAAVFIVVVGGDDEPLTAPSEQVSADTLLTSGTASMVQSSGLTGGRAERFPFDPNTADSAELRRLGLSPQLVSDIYRYRAAGGVFQRKEDFARLYHLTVRDYRELEPYISISPDYQPASTLFARQRRPTAPGSQPSTVDTVDDGQRRLRYPVKLEVGETIDLSTADTTALQRIPGIGPYFARRIVSYGERLGGYVNLEQLTEIEDFPVGALDYLTLSPVATRRLNINSLSLNDLKRHPYINFYMARAIVDFRRQYGAINDLSDLRLLPDFPDEVIERLRPYVEY